MLIQKCFDHPVVLRCNMTSVYVFTICEQRIICPNVLKSRPRGCKCIFSKPIKKLKLSKLTKWLSIGMTNFWDISRSFVCNLRLRKQIIVDAYLVCIEFTFDRDKYLFFDVLKGNSSQNLSKFKKIYHVFDFKNQ